MAQQHRYDLVSAHRHCTLNRQELAASAQCGCFHCCRIFAPTEIVDWIDPAPQMAAQPGQLGQSARCPYCGIDSVIGAKSGLPITSEFLNAMRAHWF